MAYPVDSINKRNIFRTVKFYVNFLIIDTKISTFIIDFRLKPSILKESREIKASGEAVEKPYS
jgi:hypothetical protein